MVTRMRTRGGKAQVFVKKTTRKLKKGRSRRVGTGGYWRDIRPKGKKLTVAKTPIKLYPVRDEQGYFRGYRRKR